MAKNLNSFMKSTSILAILLIAISGFNRNVTVFNSSTGTDGLGILKADIRMLGKNGERLC